MIKKILGVVLFLIGIWFSISMILFVFKMIFIENKDFEGKNGVYIMAYYFGQIALTLFFSFLIFLLFKYGYRMMKGRKPSQTSNQEIDSIGEN